MSCEEVGCPIFNDEQGGCIILSLTDSDMITASSWKTLRGGVKLRLKNCEHKEEVSEKIEELDRKFFPDCRLYGDNCRGQCQLISLMNNQKGWRGKGDMSKEQWDRFLDRCREMGKDCGRQEDLTKAIERNKNI